MNEKELKWKEELDCEYVFIGRVKWLAVFKDTVKVGVQKGLLSKSRGIVTGELMTNDISDIKFQPAGFGVGAFIMIKRGTTQSDLSDGKLINYPDGNSYGLTFKKNRNADAKKLYKFLMEIIKENSKANTVTSNSNSLDDLKKLSDLKDSGVITDKEFENKKKELLDRI